MISCCIIPPLFFQIWYTRFVEMVTRACQRFLKMVQRERVVTCSLSWLRVLATIVQPRQSVDPNVRNWLTEKLNISLPVMVDHRWNSDFDCKISTLFRISFDTNNCGSEGYTSTCRKRWHVAYLERATVNVFRCSKALQFRQIETRASQWHLTCDTWKQLTWLSRFFFAFQPPTSYPACLIWLLLIQQLTPIGT